MLIKKIWFYFQYNNCYIHEKHLREKKKRERGKEKKERNIALLLLSVGF